MTSNLAALSADELIGKGIAPIKRDFWKPVAPRQEVAAVGSSQSSAPAKRKSKKKAKQVRSGSDHFLMVDTPEAPAIIAGRVAYARLCGCRSARARLISATTSWLAIASLLAPVASVTMQKLF